MSTPSQAPETSFYIDEGVRVTNARLIVTNTTYSMANVTSVRRMIEDPSRIGPIVTGLFGLALLVAGFSETPVIAGVVIFGLLLVGVAVVWWVKQKPLYHLRIASSSGESNAISDYDGTRIEKIVQAVNEAIISRG